MMSAQAAGCDNRYWQPEWKFSEADQSTVSETFVSGRDGGKTKLAYKRVGVLKQTSAVEQCWLKLTNGQAHSHPPTITVCT